MMISCVGFLRLSPFHSGRVVPRRNRERVDANGDLVGNPSPKPVGQRRILIGEVSPDEALEQVTRELGFERSYAPPPDASVGRIVGGDLESTLRCFLETLRDDRVALCAAPQRRTVIEEPKGLHQRPRFALGCQPHRDRCGIEEILYRFDVPGARSDHDAPW